MSIRRDAVRSPGDGVNRYGFVVAIGALLLIAATLLLTRLPGVRSLARRPVPARPQASPVASLPTNPAAPENHRPAPMTAALRSRSSAAADAPREFEAALQAAKQVEDPAARNAALLAACRQFGRQFPAQAVGFARQLGLDDVSGEGFDDLVQDWADQDPATALAWVEREKTGTDRDRLLSRVLFAWAQSDPAAAAAAVMFHFHSEQAQADALISVLHQWGLREPNAALIWAHGLAPGPLRTRALDELDALAAKSM